jgi:hypothetical protein
MVSQHTAGDEVSYNTFGTYIFKRLNGSEAINQVDKITFNNVKIMGVEKIQKPFSYAEGVKENVQSDIDR